MSSDVAGDHTVSPWSLRFRVLVVIGMVALLGAIGGVLSATGKPLLIAAFFGAVLVLMIISSRVALFWFVMISGLIVTGLCQLYVPQLKYVRYLVPLASAPLLLHGLADYFTSWTRAKAEPFPAIMAWAMAFALACLVSALVNLSDPVVALVGIKDYLGMWGLFLSVVFLRWPATF